MASGERSREQLGKKEQFKDYYTPLSAPGQTAWMNLLQGEPLVIMLDELPPYFVNAASKSIGNSDLSVVTATALSNLLVAVGRDELRNVCLVITDLTASYGAGSQQIITALQDLERETGRTAMNLEPVRMNTDEFYHILRKRIFETLPDETEIDEVAQGYARAVREAKQMDVTNASPEQFASRVAEAYPSQPRGPARSQADRQDRSRGVASVAQGVLVPGHPQRLRIHQPPEEARSVGGRFAIQRPGR